LFEHLVNLVFHGPLLDLKATGLKESVLLNALSLCRAL
jgi:hypothetical protein